MPAKNDPIQAKLIEQRHYIIGKQFDGIGLLRSGRLAVPSQIASDHTVGCFEVVNLTTPLLPRAVDTVNK
jgi:hypothetical protein